MRQEGGVFATVKASSRLLSTQVRTGLAAAPGLSPAGPLTVGNSITFPRSQMLVCKMAGGGGMARKALYYSDHL